MRQESCKRVCDVTFCLPGAPAHLFFSLLTSAMKLTALAIFLSLAQAASAGNCDALTSQLRLQAAATLPVGGGREAADSHTSGNVTMTTPLMMASASKFPAATAIAGVSPRGT